MRDEGFLGQKKQNFLLYLKNAYKRYQSKVR